MAAKSKSSPTSPVSTANNSDTEQPRCSSRTIADGQQKSADSLAPEISVQEILDTIPQQLLVIDRDFKVIMANQAAQRNYSLEPGTSNARCYQYLHGNISPCSKHGVQCLLELVAKSKKREKVTHTHLDRQGQLRILEIDATPILDHNDEFRYIIETATDITGYVHAEQALRQQKDFAESLIETAQAIVLVLDPEGRIMRFNDYMSHVSGYSLDEVVGREWFETFLPESDRVRIHQKFDSAISNTATKGNINPIITKDGRLRQIEWYDKTLQDNDGNIVGLLAIGHDITERIEAEQDKVRLEAQLRQSQKMEAIGQLASGVAHDFNNILTAILGNAELMSAELEAELPPDDTLIQGLAQIERSGQRAASLTRQLLAFSRRQVFQPDILDLNQIIHDIKDMLRSLLSGRIVFKLDLDEQLKPIHADTVQIEQILMNLLLNARDAMPNGGVVSLSTANVTLDDDFLKKHPMPCQGSCIELTVSDTGCGMSPEIIDRIFEPFFTSKTQGRGTGLGLSTVYGIVKQASGCITVDSELGHGTTFKIYLPVASHQHEQPHTTAHDDSTKDRTETVLVCDDEDSVRTLACRFLERGGYTTLSAANSTEAESLARTYDAPIDVLLTDLLMHDMDGVELSRKIRQIHPDIKLIFMSGYSATDIDRRIKIPPGSHFILKPFRMQNLLESMRNLLTASETG